MTTVLGVKFLGLGDDARQKIEAYVREREKKCYALNLKARSLKNLPKGERRAHKRLPLSRSDDVEITVSLNGETVPSDFLPINLSVGGFSFAYSGKREFCEGDIFEQVHVRSKDFDFVCPGIVVYVLRNDLK